MTSCSMAEKKALVVDQLHSTLGQAENVDMSVVDSPHTVGEAHTVEAGDDPFQDDKG